MTQDITVNDPDNPESVVVTRRDKNGKITTMRVNPPPPNMPNVPPDQYNPFPPGFDPGKQMTPAERERLKRLMRQRMRNANVSPKE